MSDRLREMPIEKDWRYQATVYPVGQFVGIGLLDKMEALGQRHSSGA